MLRCSVVGKQSVVRVCIRVLSTSAPGAPHSIRPSKRRIRHQTYLGSSNSALYASENKQQRRRHISGSPIQRPTARKTNNNGVVTSSTGRAAAAVSCACHAPLRGQQELSGSAPPKKNDSPSRLAPLQCERSHALSPPTPRALRLRADPMQGAPPPFGSTP